MTKIDEITTATFLTAEEIQLIHKGFRHMVDNGYSKLYGVTAILRTIAVDIEYARRELDYVTRHRFPSMVVEAEARIRCQEAGLRNLAWRAGR